MANNSNLRIREITETLRNAAENNFSLRVEKSGDNDEIDKLAHALNEVLEKAEKKEKEIQDKNAVFLAIKETAPVALIRLDTEGKILSLLNPVAEKLLDLSTEEAAGRLLNELLINADKKESQDFRDSLCNGKPLGGLTVQGKKEDGTSGHFRVYTSIIRGKDGQVTGIIAMIEDITERVRAEAALKDSEEKYRSVIENSVVGVYIVQDGIFRFVNNRWCEIFGYTREEAIGILGPAKTCPPEYKNFVESNMLSRLSGDRTEQMLKAVRKNGEIIDISVVGGPIIYNGRPAISGSIIDITDRTMLESQLRQAQKMEAVGNLAGGVAHDFNNLLSVIVGYTELSLAETGESGQVHSHLKEILNAANRSSEIVRQLLAFARKQTISPRVINLNETTENILTIIKRMIGEDINISWNASPDLWLVSIDPVQIEQILVNLCINARDAIAGVGNIEIETDNMIFDEIYCNNHAGAKHGEYVMIAVSDNGCGIEKDNIHKIFDPFFSTKPMGQGTGLGLATVFGIVKQNNGFINVYSEIDRGTTFKVYLPRHPGQADKSAVKTCNVPVTGNDKTGETILIVEDEPMILELAGMMLANYKYKVLTARTPEEALRLTDENSCNIHLLLTDVILPDMNGKALAEKLLEKCPNAKILYMSGYTANVIAHRGMLDEGVNFLQKPFTIDALTRKVREVLDTK